MWQLGVPTPELQWRVELPSGHYALLDFAWPALQKWGECDGRIKYTDPLMLAGRTSEQVIAEQVTRQTAVERATRWTCDRWGSPELGTIAEFARFLRSVGLLPGRTA